MGQHALTHDPRDSSKKVTHLTHWPMTHWPIAWSALQASDCISSNLCSPARRCCRVHGHVVLNVQLVRIWWLLWDYYFPVTMNNYCSLAGLIVLIERVCYLRLYWLFHVVQLLHNMMINLQILCTTLLSSPEKLLLLFTFYLKSKKKVHYFSLFTWVTFWELLLLCNGVTFLPVTCTFYKVLKLVTFARLFTKYIILTFTIDITALSV